MVAKFSGVTISEKFRATCGATTPFQTNSKLSFHEALAGHTPAIHYVRVWATTTFDKEGTQQTIMKNKIKTQPIAVAEAEVETYHRPTLDEKITAFLAEKDLADTYASRERFKLNPSKKLLMLQKECRERWADPVYRTRNSAVLPYLADNFERTFSRPLHESEDEF